MCDQRRARPTELGRPSAHAGPRGGVWRGLSGRPLRRRLLRGLCWLGRRSRSLRWLAFRSGGLPLFGLPQFRSQLPGFPRRGLLLSLLGAAAVAGCSQPQRGTLQYLDQDQIRVEEPSKDHALATGIGCGFTVKEAEKRARDTSLFNLRRVTGDARYEVEFTRVREVPDPKQTCLELEARAIPPLLR